MPTSPNSISIEKYHINNHLIQQEALFDTKGYRKASFGHYHNVKAKGGCTNFDGCDCTPSNSELKEFRRKWCFLSEKERLSALKMPYTLFVKTVMDRVSCTMCRSRTICLFEELTCASGFCSNMDCHGHGHKSKFGQNRYFEFGDSDEDSSEDENCVLEETVETYTSQEQPGFLSVEGLYMQEDGVLTLWHEFLNDPDAALVLFSHHERCPPLMKGVKGNYGLKNASMRGACHLHMQRARTNPRPETFEALWNKISSKNQRYLASTNADSFLTDLENYLRRHRFCCRCKEKVLEAYDLLIGSSCSEDDCEDCAGYDLMEQQRKLQQREATKQHMELNGTYPSSAEFNDDLQYSSFLFEEIAFCRNAGAIIVPCHMEYMSQLMMRADQDIVGEWGDRHARTLAEAQDEVLTCLALVIWEKIQSIWIKSLCEKRAEELLVYLSVTGIRHSYDMAVEALHGEELMEQLLAEEDNECKRLARKREKRKEKKKKRKNNAKNSMKSTGTDDEDDQHFVAPRSMTRKINLNPSLENVDNQHDNDILSRKQRNHLDEDAEMQLLSSMGWCDIASEVDKEHAILILDETPEQDDFGISKDDIKYWKQNQSNLVSKRLEQRKRLKDQFNDFVSRKHV